MGGIPGGTQAELQNLQEKQRPWWTVAILYKTKHPAFINGGCFAGIHKFSLQKLRKQKARAKNLVTILI